MVLKRILKGNGCLEWCRDKLKHSCLWKQQAKNMTDLSRNDTIWNDYRHESCRYEC